MQEAEICHEQSAKDKYVHQRNGGLKSSHVIQVLFQKLHVSCINSFTPYFSFLTLPCLQNKHNYTNLTNLPVERINYTTHAHPQSVVKHYINISMLIKPHNTM